MSRAKGYIRKLPPYYAGVLEIELIAAALGSQGEQLDSELDRLLGNQFIKTSDSMGLLSQEQLLEIIPSPGESLEFRRKRLVDRRSRRPPFTWKWLQERLDDLLEGQYLIFRNLEEQSLRIYILLTKLEHVEFIQAYVLDIIPANMITNVVLKYNTHADLGLVTHRVLGQFRHGRIPITPL